LSVTPPVLRFEAVGKSFGPRAARVHVLADIDLSVESGEFLMVTGPSGSGKSTFLHLSALLDTPTAGRVELLGEDMSRASEDLLCRARAERLGIVFQRYALLGRRSALENVLFRFRYTHHPSREARELAHEALNRVHLAHVADRPARLLSGGEMQRVAIARAIAARPALLVADEPTGNLDGANADGIMQVFGELNDAGLTIVMVTHNPKLLSYATRHLALDDGAFRKPNKGTH
jgi:putative ABC transport system ATP-binding protein